MAVIPAAVIAAFVAGVAVVMMAGGCRVEAQSAAEQRGRLLKYFQSEGLVRLSRGAVELTAPERLAALAAGSLR